MVQICLNGSWIDVYGDTWSNEDAAVACRQLGYSFYGKLQVKMYVYIQQDTVTCCTVKWPSKPLKNYL